MSDIKKAKELLKRYSSARIPFIVINTMERDRTLEVLKEVAEELTISFFVHTMSKGIYDISSGKVLSEDKSMPFSITGTEEKVTKKIEKNEYEGFANGFPEWTLEPPQIAVRRKK